jgi:hypothetical protein
VDFEGASSRFRFDYINMTGTKYKSGVACGFYTTSSGSIWAAQNFQ